MRNIFISALFLIISYSSHAATGDFAIYDPTGGLVGSPDTGVSSSIIYPGGGSVLSSPNSFLGSPWFAHSITTYQDGTYTVDTVEGGSYTFTVGIGQIGVHMLFDWGATSNIDVVNVWNVTETAGIVHYAASDWDGDGVGGAMIDGPFIGFSAVFNLDGFDLPLADKPSITLIGDAVINLQTGDIYVDAGATAFDALDGDLTASIIVTNPVDTLIAGTYTVTYSVTDSDANTTNVIRTVIVTQGNFPVLTLNGAATINVLKHNAYADAGATASDVEDGDITANIVTSSNVDTSIIGSYTVTYDVTDSNFNASTAYRTVNVVTGDVPIITLLGDATVLLSLGNTYSDAGAVAGDTEDGDITASIVTVNPVDTSVAGLYTITYNAVDSNANAAFEVTRTVEVIDPNVVGGAFSIYDTTGVIVGAPDTAVSASIIYPGAGSSISSPTPFFGIQWSAHDVTTYQNGTYTIDTVEGGSYTFTVAEGQIGVHILIDWSATLDIDVINVWDVSESSGVVSYTSTDWDGDGILGAAMIDGPFVGFSANFDLLGVALPAVNNVPTLILNGSDTINLQVGDTYIESGAMALDAEDGDLTTSIVITNPVDTLNSGTYSVVYSVTDSAGNTVSVIRTVIVAQGAFPVITLNGQPSVNAYIGEAYLDEGATATDAEDGDITSNIVSSSDVNTNVVGAYTVSYSVTDVHLNTSTISRTINVIRGNIPVITLQGDSTVILFTGETYIDAGATASDTEDGDVTSSIVVTHAVNTAIAGNYSVKYNVIDSNGNSAVQKTRTVTVLIADGNAQMCIFDTNGNVVGCDGSVQAYINFPGAGSTLESPTPFFGANWTAHDITTYLEGTHSIDTIEGGTYTFTVGAGQIGAHILFDWAATNNIDIVLVWDVTVETDGTLTLTSTDWDGDGINGAPMVDGPFLGFNANFDVSGVVTALPTDNTPPEISLVGSASQTVYADTIYYDMGATAYDAENGDLTYDISVAGSVNTSVTGTYSLTYSVTDYDGYSVSTVRTVYVVEADVDNDGVLYLNDNCTAIANADQRDTDADGFGNMCDADLNNDNMVNAVDLGLFKQRYFTSDADADLNGDGIVNARDLGMFKQLYGKQPGPSGLN